MVAGAYYFSDPPGMSKFSVLVDRTGATSANNDLEMVKAMQGVLNYVYPERLAKVIIHPTTVVFWSFFNIAKWFLDPVTREKICPCMYFYGVQEHIADEYIPATLGGGKCTYEFNHEDYVDAYPEEEVPARAGAAGTAVRARSRHSAHLRLRCARRVWR